MIEYSISICEWILLLLSTNPEIEKVETGDIMLTSIAFTLFAVEAETENKLKNNHKHLSYFIDWKNNKSVNSQETAFLIILITITIINFNSQKKIISELKF